MTTKIRKDETLIVVALEEELDKNDLVGWRVVYTGIGKVNALIAVGRAIREKRPSKIINFGTAGSSKSGLSGLHEVTLFKQRDMDVRPLGFELGETPLDEINDINLERPGLSCATGDSFVNSSQDIDVDLFDMESYAIAKLCLIEDIDFSCFKYVSDNADGDASQDWKRNVASGSSYFIELLDSLYG